MGTLAGARRFSSPSRVARKYLRIGFRGAGRGERRRKRPVNLHAMVILLEADGRERESSVTGSTTMIDTSRASVTPSVLERHPTAERAVAVTDETLSLEPGAAKSQGIPGPRRRCTPHGQNRRSDRPLWPCRRERPN